VVQDVPGIEMELAGHGSGAPEHKLTRTAT
jgi:hypothetical protein